MDGVVVPGDVLDGVGVVNLVGVLSAAWCRRLCGSPRASCRGTRWRPCSGDRGRGARAHRDGPRDPGGHQSWACRTRGSRSTVVVSRRAGLDEEGGLDPLDPDGSYWTKGLRCHATGLRDLWDEQWTLRVSSEDLDLSVRLDLAGLGLPLEVRAVHVVPHFETWP